MDYRFRPLAVIGSAGTARIKPYLSEFLLLFTINISSLNKYFLFHFRCLLLLIVASNGSPLST